MTAAITDGAAALVRQMRAKHALLILALTLAWCALWGSITVANVLSGIAVSGAIVAYGVYNRTGLDGITSGRVRLKPLGRLAYLVAKDLVLSTYSVTREVLTPGQGDEAIVAVPLTEQARHHYLLLVVGITVTPGTAVVTTDFDRNVLYVHLLHREDKEEVIAHVQELSDLACAAFPHDSVGADAEPADDTAVSGS